MSSYAPIGKPVYRRLDRDRFSGLPQAKKIRIVDEAVLEEARRRGYCEWCDTPGPTDPSHSVSVGAGGDDTRLNVTSLCRECHEDHHRGKEPKTEQLLDLARRREANRAEIDRAGSMLGAS